MSAATADAPTHSVRSRPSIVPRIFKFRCDQALFTSGSPSRTLGASMASMTRLSLAFALYACPWCARPRCFGRPARAGSSSPHIASIRARCRTSARLPATINSISSRPRSRDRSPTHFGIGGAIALEATHFELFRLEDRWSAVRRALGTLSAWRLRRPFVGRRRTPCMTWISWAKDRGQRRMVDAVEHRLRPRRTDPRTLRRRMRVAVGTSRRV